MGQQITSSSVTAAEAISELVGIDTSTSENQTVDFSYTTEIAGMETARELTNNLLTAVSQFSQAVLVQANKFPEIAAVIEKRDVELSKRWEGN